MARTPTPRLADMVAADRSAIIDKATLRTQITAEKSYAKQADTRPTEVLEYEAMHFDNPESQLANDLRAALIWAAIRGIENPVFHMSQPKAVALELATVLVPVDSRHHKWQEPIKVGTPYLCVNSSYGSFRGMDGEKVKPQFHTLNSRTGSDAEIEAIVDKLLELRPALTIKLLGNSDKFPGTDDD